MTVELSDTQCDILYNFMYMNEDKFGEYKVALGIILESVKLKKNLANAEISALKKKIMG